MTHNLQFFGSSERLKILVSLSIVIGPISIFANRGLKVVFSADLMNRDNSALLMSMIKITTINKY